MTSRSTLAAMLAVVPLLAGCAVEPPFERTNPYDPHNTLDISLVGPDSVHSYNQTISYDVVSDPPLPGGDYIIKWFVYSDMSHPFTGAPIISTDILPSEGGEFLVRAATTRYRRYTVVANFEDVAVGQVIHTGQKATTLELSCAPWTAAFHDCSGDWPLDPESPIRLHPRGTDPNGHALNDIRHAVRRVAVTVRTPSVLAHAPIAADTSAFVRLIPTGLGSTWVVVRMDDAVDSVQVTIAH